MNKVDVVLLNWQGIKYTPKCIESLLKQTLLPHRIIIVDQASTDGSKEFIRMYIEHYLNKPLRMIELEENVGFSKGNNIAVKYALEFEDKPDYILYFNNDTIAFPDMIETMVKCFSEVEKVGACGTIAFDYKTKKQLAGVGGWIRRNDDYLSIDGFGSYWEDGYVKVCQNCGMSMGTPLEIKNKTENFTLKCPKCRWEPYNQIYIQCDYIGGGCLMIPVKVLSEVGLFDENYVPIYVEDVDLACRIREAGYKVTHINKSGFYHLVSASTSKERSKFWGYHQNCQKYFIQKWKERIDKGVV